jgi:hypothetical protein
MDALYQFMLLGKFHPGEMLILTFVLVFLSYLLLRGPVARIGRLWRAVSDRHSEPRN